MSTRSNIGMYLNEKHTSLIARYHHFDGYPTGVGRSLYHHLHKAYGGNYAAMMEYIVSADCGWSTLNDKDLRLPRVWCESYDRDGASLRFAKHVMPRMEKHVSDIMSGELDIKYDPTWRYTNYTKIKLTTYESDNEREDVKDVEEETVIYNDDPTFSAWMAIWDNAPLAYRERGEKGGWAYKSMKACNDEYVYLADIRKNTMHVFGHRYEYDKAPRPLLAIVDMLGPEPDWQAMEDKDQEEYSKSHPIV